MWRFGESLKIIFPYFFETVVNRQASVAECVNMLNDIDPLVSYFFMGLERLGA